MTQMHPLIADVLHEIVRAVLEIIVIALTSTIVSLPSNLGSITIIRKWSVYFKYNLDKAYRSFPCMNVMTISLQANPVYRPWQLSNP